MKKTKLILVGVIILAILAVIAYIIFPKQVKQAVGISYEPKIITIMGSAINLESVPSSYVLANSTTTSATQYTDGGHTVQQAINTNGIEEGLLCYRALGGDATSTLNIMQMGSYDGTNFFNVGSSTDLSIIGTTTPTLLAKVPVSFDPGTATTTGQCQIVSVKGYKFTRFIPMAEDVNAVDGVQAWIYFVVKDDINR